MGVHFFGIFCCTPICHRHPVGCVYKKYIFGTRTVLPKAYVATCVALYLYAIIGRHTHTHAHAHTHTYRRAPARTQWCGGASGV